METQGKITRYRQLKWAVPTSDMLIFTTPLRVESFFSNKAAKIIIYKIVITDPHRRHRQPTAGTKLANAKYKCFTARLLSSSGISGDQNIFNEILALGLIRK